MQKFLVTWLLAMIASNAMAEWTPFVKGNTSTSYRDISTIRRSGSTIKMWTLMDYVQPKSMASGQTYYSAVLLTEYDCAEGRTRTLQGAAFSGKMRSGEMVLSGNTVSAWSYPIPDSVGAVELDNVCKGK